MHQTNCDQIWLNGNNIWPSEFGHTELTKHLIGQTEQETVNSDKVIGQLNMTKLTRSMFGSNPHVYWLSA